MSVCVSVCVGGRSMSQSPRGNERAKPCGAEKGPVSSVRCHLLALGCLRCVVHHSAPGSRVRTTLDMCSAGIFQETPDLAVHVSF